MSQRPVFGYEWLKRMAKEITGSVLIVGSGTDEQNIRALFDVISFKNLDINPACNPDIVADVQNMPVVPSLSQDCIVVHRMIEQVPNIDAAFNEFHRILKPNGILLISFVGPAYKDPTFRRFLDGEAEEIVAKYFKIASVEKLREFGEHSATYIRARK